MTLSLSPNLSRRHSEAIYLSSISRLYAKAPLTGSLNPRQVVFKFPHRMMISIVKSVEKDAMRNGEYGAIGAITHSNFELVALADVPLVPFHEYTPSTAYMGTLEPSRKRSEALPTKGTKVGPQERSFLGFLEMAGWQT